MITYIALLRGINVGGHRKVPMADLRALLTNSGLENVQTYIQTGNVVFQSSKDEKGVLQELIQKNIKKHFGFEVPVLVLQRIDLQRVFDDSPFSGFKKEESYFLMLETIPDKELVKIASEKTYPDDEFKIINDCIYVHCANGYGRAKFNSNFFERKLKVFATARNYKTMMKLLSLSQN